MTGAPGSKWSSVFKHIHSSPDVDSTDSSEERTYWHDAETPGTKQLAHTGAYFDPEMEFGTNVEEWSKPFTGVGKRIIKSHTFAHRLDKLKNLGFPIVIVYRNSFECIEWWKLCGEFNITYPNYQYFKDLDTMWQHIQNENNDIMEFVHKNKDKIVSVESNHALCDRLGIAKPTTHHHYKPNDIKVYLYE